MKKLLAIIVVTVLAFSEVAANPNLSSLPSASATIYLDFDGETVAGTPWNGGNPLVCAPTVLTDEQVTEIFNRVSEDFRPFEVNITTDSAVFFAAPLNQRMRVIVTPTSDWYPNVGGVAFTGSFTWGTDVPAFVFPDKLGNKPKLIAECCSHESGHTLGLSHQAKYDGNCSLIATYNDGLGSGETAWAPVMGNSYYRNLSGWNNGPTPSGCLADQDNLSIITSYNGFSYRGDDHGDDMTSPSEMVQDSATAFSQSGVITTNADRDYFHVSLTKNSMFKLAVNPFSVAANNEGADLDVKVTLMNADSQVLKVFDDSSSLSISIDTVLTEGDYYVAVEGAGNANATNYGSLGSYTISGLYMPLTVTPVNEVKLAGSSTNDLHKLTWSVSGKELLKNIVLESSFDGTIFKTLSTFFTGSNAYEYRPFNKGNIYYRLRVNSQDGSYAYSNIIALKAEEITDEFKISTIVHDNITVHASKNFSYQLLDASGRYVSKGNGAAGLNNIGISGRPNGIYFIQISTDESRSTERIIRM